MCSQAASRHAAGDPSSLSTLHGGCTGMRLSPRPASLALLAAHCLLLAAALRPGRQQSGQGSAGLWPGGGGGGSSSGGGALGDARSTMRGAPPRMPPGCADAVHARTSMLDEDTPIPLPPCSTAAAAPAAAPTGLAPNR